MVKLGNQDNSYVIYSSDGNPDENDDLVRLEELSSKLEENPEEDDLQALNILSDTFKVISVGDSYEVRVDGEVYSSIDEAVDEYLSEKRASFAHETNGPTNRTPREP